MDDGWRGLSFAAKGLVGILFGAGALIAARAAAALLLPSAAIPLLSTVGLSVLFVTVALESFVMSAAELYRQSSEAQEPTLLLNIIGLNAASLFAVWLFCFILLPGERAFLTVWLSVGLAFSTALILLGRWATAGLLRYLRPRRGAVVIGDGEELIARLVSDMRSSRELDIAIFGFASDEPYHIDGCEWLGPMSELSAILGRYRPYYAVIAFSDIRASELERLVGICDKSCVRIYFAPSVKVGAGGVGRLPLLAARDIPLDNPVNSFFKRSVDVIGALLLLLISSPLMLAAAIGVRLSSPGPILFRQDRIGYGGRRFEMLKFRSMRVNDGDKNTWTTADDPRKTRFGSFIRKISVDELPQLINVLRGDMSLVGPRPEIPHFVDKFKDSIPQYMLKHYVKPGLTGLAQVRGLRGDTSLEDRIRSDVEYIEQWSLLMDVSIILATPLRIVSRGERCKRVQGGESLEKRAKSPRASCDALSEKRGKSSWASCDADAEKCAAIPQAERASRTKILYVASTVSHLKTFHTGYIDALRADGYEVMTMARGEWADYDIPFEKKMLSASNAACRRRIKKILASENFDVIILNTSLAAFHVRLCLSRRKRPVVVNFVHGYLFGSGVGILKRVLLLLAERFVASRTDSVITMNRADMHAALKYKLCRGRVYLCRGTGAGLREVSRDPEELRRAHGCRGSFVLLFVGELSERKNQRFLIGALAVILRYIPNAVLWLVGDGDARIPLESLAAELGISHAVMFLGYRDNPAEYMSSADLYVSASRIEGMPHNLIEAMGTGKTVLASRVKGHSDLIEDGVSGFLYECGNRLDFIEKVLKIHSGELSLKTDNIKNRYNQFTKEAVFDKTYETVKRSFVK